MGWDGGVVQGPLITAHTGCERTRENTLDSITAGVAAGADAVEIDVRATADGVGILRHDEAVRLRGGTLARVGRLTLEELRGVAGRTNETVLLEDALALAKQHDVIVNLDVKDDNGVPSIVRAVEQFRMTEQVVLSGCPRERAAGITTLYPGLRVLLNTDSISASADDAEYDEFVIRSYRDAVYSGCCGINVDYRICRESLVRFARRRFLPVSVWTVNAVDAMRSMASMGVAAITTYEPRVLLRVLCDCLDSCEDPR